MTTSKMRTQSAFRSFWLAGYDGADHLDRGGRPLSVADITQHVRMAPSDYSRLREFGIRTVRETVGWRLVDRGAGNYDFSSLDCRVESARKQGLQVAWTLCHYGWPDGLDPLSDAFVDRFARYARSVALYLGDRQAQAPVYTPIEEISYLAWAASNGQLRDHPSLKGRGTQFKRQLVRAAIAACDAIREIDPRARFLHTDPLMHVVAPKDRPDLEPAARAFCDAQFEAWDLIGGREQPELGGQPRHLDLLGVSYYLGSQWEIGTGKPLGWRIDDPRRRPFAELLGDVHRRYGRPLVIAETGHVGVERGAWVREIAGEVQSARKAGVPIEGICLFPMIDRPDMQNPAIWHSSGLWELAPDANGLLERRLNAPYARAVQDARLITQAVVSGRSRSPERPREIA
jgi:UDP-galactopyranose mutase